MSWWVTCNDLCDYPNIFLLAKTLDECPAMNPFLKTTIFCVVVALSGPSNGSEFVEIEDKASYYCERVGAYGFGWIWDE